VSLAIEILKVEPKKDVASDPLRDWAVDVLKLDSPVAVTPQAQEELRNKRLAYDKEWQDVLNSIIKDSGARSG
jgi:hypothetical protein